MMKIAVVGVLASIALSGCTPGLTAANERDGIVNDFGGFQQDKAFAVADATAASITGLPESAA
jgi:hypothetical protein